MKMEVTKGAIEHFSIECRKSKIITPANHIKNKLPNEPIRTRSKYMELMPIKCWKTCVQPSWCLALIDFGFLSDGLKRWHKIFLITN